MHSLVVCTVHKIQKKGHKVWCCHLRSTFILVSGIFRPIRNWRRLKMHLLFPCWVRAMWLQCDHGHILWKYCVLFLESFILCRDCCSSVIGQSAVQFMIQYYIMWALLNTSHLAIEFYAYKKLHTVLSLYIL